MYLNTPPVPLPRCSIRCVCGHVHLGQVARVSHEKRAPKGWLPLGYLLGMKNFLAMLYRDYFINHEIRIPMNQPGFQWKVRPGFFRGSGWFFVFLESS